MPTIAIVGASSDRSKFGNKALRAFRNQGYTVVPIHPSETDVEGERAYARAVDYPGQIDEASIYVAPRVGVKVMEDLAAKHVPVVWLNPGADGPDVVARAEALGLKVIVACSILGVGESPGAY